MEKQREEVNKAWLVELGEGIEKINYIPHQTNATVGAVLLKKQNTPGKMHT